MHPEVPSFAKLEKALHAGSEPARLPGPKKLGMWVFIAADSATFLALMAAYGYIRGSGTHWPRSLSWWPDVAASAAMTVILLAGSLCAFMGARAIRAGSRGGTSLWLVATAGAGLLFGFMQRQRWIEIIHQGVTLFRNPWGTPLFGASFFTLTGFHLIHVTAGIFYLGGLAYRAARGKASAEDVETGALYWHFISIMWLLIFLLLILPSARTG